MTNQTAISAEKNLSENDKIGMGVSISLAILLLIGVCYFGCVFRFRSKEIENIKRENVDRRPSLIEHSKSRRPSKLEIRTPKGESKV